MLVDKRILAGGLAMLIVGIALSAYTSSLVPTGTPGMSEEQKIDLLLKQQENTDINTLANILIGVGFLLVLISFGARRKQKDPAKKVEKKPDVDTT